MVGQKYQNVKKGATNFGRIATVDRFDKVAKTVVLLYDDGNGGTKVSLATLNSAWKRVQEEEQEPVETMVNVESDTAKKSEEVCGDGTPYTQVMKEIVKGAEKKAKVAKKEKEKKEKVKKEKVSVDDLYSKIESDIISAGFTAKRYTAQPRSITILNSKNKGFCTVYLGNGKLCICIPVSKVPEGYTPTRVRNCPYGAAFEFGYDNTTNFKNLLTTLKEER